MPLWMRFFATEKQVDAVYMREVLKKEDDYNRFEQSFDKQINAILNDPIRKN